MVYHHILFSLNITSWFNSLAATSRMVTPEVFAQFGKNLSPELKQRNEMHFIGPPVASGGEWLKKCCWWLMNKSVFHGLFVLINAFQRLLQDFERLINGLENSASETMVQESWIMTISRTMVNLWLVMVYAQQQSLPNGKWLINGWLLLSDGSPTADELWLISII